MLSVNNDYIAEASNTIYKLSAEERIQKVCRDREEYYQDLRTYKRELARKDAEIAEKDVKLIQLQEEVEKLRKELSKNDGQNN